MTHEPGPDFSPMARSYALSRPRYPDRLFDWLASLVDRHELAWDTATGSGQAALGLAERFGRVVATDTSAEQIRHAHAHPGIEYRVGPSEDSGLEDASVDLVTTAAAIHWFDLPRFYGELRRVVRPGGVAAAWTYHVGYVAPPFDELFHWFYFDLVRPYFAEHVILVDDRYEAIELPGEEIEAPVFETSAVWSFPEMLDFVRTWSGVRAFAEETGGDAVAELERRAAGVWGSPETRHRIRWPIYTKVARL